MRRLSAPLAAVLAAALLAGCAGQSSTDNAKRYQGDRKAVAQVVDDFASAIKKRDAKTLCATILAPSLTGHLHQGVRDCQDVVGDQAKDASTYDLKVQSIQVSGTTATARVRSQFDGEDRTSTLELTRQGKAWRISGIR